MRTWIHCTLLLSGFAILSFADTRFPPDLAQNNINGTIGGKCPAPYHSDSGGAFVNGEFLYMVPNEDGLTYAWTFPETFPSNAGEYTRTGPLPDGKAHEPDLEWAPGLRLSTGYRFPQLLWELSLSWTYYHNHSKSSTSIPSFDTNSLIATWFPAGFYAAEYMALDASADWTLDFNTLDLILARSTFSTKKIVLTPYLAFRGSFIHQRFATSYSQGEFINEVGTNIESVKMTMRNSFDGWGLRPGFNTSWFLTKNWSLYANGAVSLLFGRFSTNEHAKMTSDSNRNFITSHDSFFQNAFEIDMGLGTRWEMFFEDGKRRFAFSAGYETMSWFEQNQLFNYYFIDRAPGEGQPSQGDLGIQGINLSAYFDF